jgi:uncharacterized protein YndB with AHSA1/START domain
MDRKIENTFEVAVSVENVWNAMTDPAELNKWYFPFRIAEDGTTHTEIAGDDRQNEVVAFEPMHTFHLRSTNNGQEHWPPVGPASRDMVVVVEATATGTRVIITHSGFGDGDDWDQVLASTSRGVAETIADLVLYLETGVGVRRHPALGTSFHGIGAVETRAGLLVRSVQQGTFADLVGLAAGDILVELNGASVFGLPELNFFIREHAPGEVVDAAWVRNGTLMRGSAELGPRLRMRATI